MYKLVTIYRQVDDAQKIDDFFSSTHLQLAEKLPNLIKSEVSRVTHKPGGQSRFYLMYELYFESQKALQASFVSEVGIALIQALQPWTEAKIVSWFYAEAFEEAPARRDENEVEINA